MCFAPDSQFFWIISSLLVLVSLMCLMTLRQLFRQVISARSAAVVVQALVDHFPALIVNGIWLFIVVTVASACWFLM